MFSLRSAIVTLVIFTQVWTPVLAQTLPITVDKTGGGPRPVVGVAGNGVPIVNIAPPSAGGVSNNRFTQFNVGPSGVVLNNSGAGSQSQLAGAIGGNPMLGNSRAAVILNQVTGNNPSQLRGFMEVAGNRANVIVANPAGITCDGCGFLNANRGTLTTGMPILGPDGSVQGFDVTRGRLSVEGKGLYGDNPDQVDLIARTLSLNASVWANRLNLVAGPATVGYNDGSVQAKAGEDAAPAVALDMAALGGMYANSIRLIGTEAGVGVNIGGNLTAMTGDLQVSAAGDVRIVPSGKVQAAGNLQLDSARAMTVDGTVAAGGDVRLNAAGDVTVGNAVSAVGSMAVNAGGNLVQGANARMQANAGLTASAGGVAALSGTTASQGAVGVQSRGGMAVDGLVSAGGNVSLNAGGNLTQSGAGRMETNGALSAASGGAIALSGTSVALGAVTVQAPGSLAMDGRVSAGGDISLGAGGNLTQGGSGRMETNGALVASSRGAIALAGAAVAQGTATLQSAGAMSADGQLSAGRDISLNAGGNLTQGGGGRIETNGAIAATSGAAMALAGTTSAGGAVNLRSPGAMSVDGRVSSGGGIALNAGGSLTQGGNGRLETNGSISGSSTGAMALSGVTVGKGAVALRSANGLTLAGQVSAGSDISLNAAGGLAQMAGAGMQANGGLAAWSGGAMALSGSSAALGDVALQSLAGMTVNGQVASGRNATLDAGADIVLGNASKVQADGNVRADAAANMSIAGLVGTTGVASSGSALTLNAGRDMAIAGTVSANSPLTIAASRNLQIDGTTLATAGNFALSSGGNMTVGANGRAQAAGDIAVQSGGNLAASGILSANKAARVNAAGDTRVDGTIAALGGALSLAGGNDVLIGGAGRVQAATTLDTQAGRDLSLAGALSSVGDLTLRAARDATVSGIASSDASLKLNSRNLNVNATGVVQSASGMNIDAAGQLTSAGKLVSDGAVTLRSVGNMGLSGTTASMNNTLGLTSTAGDIVLDAGARTQAAGTLTANAARDMRVQGTTSSNGGIVLGAARDLALGGVTAALGGDLRTTAGGATTVAADARAQASGTLAVNTGSSLNNDGLLSGGQAATLQAGGDVNNRGTVVSAGNASVTTNAAVNNTGRLIAGLNDQGQIALPGNLTVSGSTFTNSGLTAAGANVTLNAANLMLAGGTVSATQALKASTAGAIDARGASLYGGTMALSGSTLDNRGGNLSSGGDMSLTFIGTVNNQSGTIATNGALQASGSQVINRGGKMIASDLTVTTPGGIDNVGGLLQANNVMSLSTSNLLNTDTPSGNPAQPLGVVGKTVTISAGAIDNTRGTLAASQAMTVNASQLQNAAGLVSSGGTADITVGTLANEAGNVAAGQRLSVTTNALTGTGTLQSQGDLGLTVNGNLNNTGVLAAGRDATLSIAGNLDNSGKISAGRNLGIGAQNLTNRAGGEIVSGGITTLSVSQALDNAGLIDGKVTRIQAGSVHNTGRIYGDTLAISTGYLLNDVGAAGAGVIASRGDMDLGVGRLDNLEHGLIYAAGNLAIGGGVDGNWKAIGQAQAVNNESATIQADGNASIAAVAINNKNNHFSSEVVQVSSGDKVYYRLNGSTDMLDGSVYWLCDQTTPQCSKDPAWLDDDQERRLLLPSTTYPEDRFGPPFDYAAGGRGKKGYDSPVRLPYYEPIKSCTAEDSWCVTSPEEFTYPLDAKIWQIFGVQPPAAPLPPVPVYGENCTINCDAMQAVYDAAHKPFLDAYLELNAKVLAFNQDFNNRLVKDFTIYEVAENVSESRTVSTDPGKIIVGGNASLSGSVINDKSQIVAGGALNASGATIQNIGATGERRVDATGRELYTYEKNDSRHYDIAPYSGTLSIQPIELAVASYGGNIALPATGVTAPGAVAPASTVRPPTITSVSLPNSGIVRTVTPPSSVPNNQLYTVVPAANSPYLVATDSRFTGNKPTISSDYLLALLGGAGVVSGPGAVAAPGSVSVRGPGAGASAGTSFPAGGTSAANQSPTQAAIAAAATSAMTSGATTASSGTNPYLQNADTLKRLGDGFYEQKLVTDQIIAATGQRFVGDYTDNETQYKALLTAGATFAQQYGLQIGTPLSDEQMKHLTSDMVWLVDQTVTLPDGSTQTVLVPQVYLVVQDGDLKGDGTLMAGRNTTLQASGTITNTGTVGSRDATIMVADNIINSSAGTIQGSYVNLNARQDLNNIAALIKGDTVALQTGRDINLTSTTASTSSTLGQTNTWSTFVSGVSQIDAGSLAINAGHDLNLTAAAVNASSNAFLQAGNDINLLTVQTEQGESVVFKKKNNSEVIRKDQVGSVINVGGDLGLFAGQDVTAIAANVTAGGEMGVQAGRDINLLSGEAGGYARDEHYQKTKGHWGVTNTQHTIDTGEWTQAQGSTFTADSAIFLAGRDISVVGSNIGGLSDVTLTGGRDVTIAAAANTSSDDHYRHETRSGWGALGGLSKGHKESTDTLEGTTVFHSASTVGSVLGDVLISAGQDLQVLGSNIVARQGDIGIVGRDVIIASVTDTNQEKEFHEVKQSGFSVNAGSPVMDAFETIDRMSTASSKTDNPIMKALAFVSAGMAANDALNAVTRPPSEGGGGGGTITLDYGASYSSTTTRRSSTTVLGSTVAAGNDLTILSTGAGKDSDITVLGSALSAGRNAVLVAEGDILMKAASNTRHQDTQTKSVDGTVGVGVMIGTDGNGGYGAGFIVKGSVSASRSTEDGDDLTWTNSSVTAGSALGLKSGGDTSLIGASGKADRILASVGGNLLLQSLQDESTYHSKNQSASAGGTYCYGYCSSSVYGSYSQGALNSNFKTVTEQTGLWAGDGGFQINVKDNTTLIGSVIASSDKAVADGVNFLSTGTLVTQDIKNVAKYDGYQVGLSGGYSWGGAQQVNSGGSTTVPSKGGASAFPPTVVAALGSDRSTTESAISGGTIVIRDSDGQLALTGKSVADSIASLNRDTSDTLNSLSPIFDKEKIQAGFDIVTTFQKETGTFLASKAQEYDALKKALDAAPPEGPLHDSLQAQLNDAAQWVQGGTYRMILTAGTAALAGNVTGGVGQAVQAATINVLQSMGAAQIKKYADALGGEGSAGHVALHAILACGGAAAQGGSCGAGALGASASVVLGELLSGLTQKQAKDLTANEREQRQNLIMGLVAGIGAALDPQSLATLTAAAQNEAENNQLGPAAGTSSIFAPPPAWGSSSGGRGSVAGLLGQGEQPLTQNQIIAQQLQSALSRLSESISSGLQEFASLTWEGLFTDQLPGYGDSGSTQNGQPIFTPIGDHTNVQTEGKPGDVLAPISLPGQVISEPQGGLITSTPSQNNAAPTLLYQQGLQSGNEMLGEHGPQFPSKTIWKGHGQERIDVENPNPGQRPGQIHYQDNQGNKYLYDPSTNSFPDAPRSVNKLLSDPSFSAAIQKGLTKYLGGR